MPTAPPHPCPDCPGLAPAGSPRCPTCTTTRQRTLRHPDRGRIYHTPRWRALRRRILDATPYCPCGALASHVDHVIPLRQGVDPFDEANLQALCAACHSRKTATEVGWHG